MDHQITKGNPDSSNLFAASGLFQSTTDVWTPFKMSLEGFAGGGKTLTMVLILLGIWSEEEKKKIVCLQDTEKSAKFIVPFLRHYGLIEGKNLFVTPSRSLIDYRVVLNLCEREHGIFMIDTVTHLHEEMLRQFSEEKKRPVTYPGDAMILKPEWKAQFTTPFVDAQKCHLFFTGRAAWEYTMELNEDTKKKEFNATGVKMRGDNELAYEPDVVVLMERLQEIGKGVVTYRRASILKDRSRLIDGKQFIFRPQNPGRGKLWDFEPVWECFRPVYRYLCAGNPVDQKQVPPPAPMGQLFTTGNAEGYWERRRQVDVLLEEIDGIYQQWVPGTGGLEKQIRSIIFNLQFNTRSKSALAERSPGELKAGLESIEHLSRYVAKNYDLLDKLYDKSDSENVTAFITEEKNRFDKRETAGAEPAPAPVEDDDKIPDFGEAAQEPAGAPDKELAKAKQELAAAAVEKIKVDPIQAMEELFGAADSVQEIEQIEEGFAPILEKLAPQVREQIAALADEHCAELMVAAVESKGAKAHGSDKKVTANSKRRNGRPQLST